MEEKELNKKEKRTLLIVSLAIVIALVFGISYAYFMAVGQSSEQTITTANLSLNFDDGTAIVNATDISPLIREVALPVQDSTGKVTTAGKAVTKEFTITNTGNQKMYVDISLEDITLPNDLKRYDFLWSLSEVIDKTNNIEKNIGIGSFEYAENGMKVGQYLVFDAQGGERVSRTFRLYIWIEETYIEQEVMMGETFKATIKATGQKYYTSPESDFVVSADGNLTEYTGPGGNVIIPPVVNGITVRSISPFIHPINGESPIASNLTSVVIPDTVTSIGERVFGSNQLTNVVIPNSVTSIGHSAFGGNQLTKVIIPNGVTQIDSTTFTGNPITNIVIPNSVTTIRNDAFTGNQLTNIIIPNNVTSIESMAFYENQLTKVVIPSNVTTIGDFPFAENPQLEEIIVIGKNSLDDFEDLSENWNCRGSVSIMNNSCSDFAPVVFKP